MRVMSDTSGLNPRQIAFINEYLISFNITQAAIKAGYSEKTAYSIGSENLKKPEIKLEIDRRMKELEKDALITKEMVIKGLLNEAQEYGEGASHSARVSAWSHLGKHLGMFTATIDITTNGESINKPAIDTSKLTDEQLRSLDTILSQASEAGTIET